MKNKHSVISLFCLLLLAGGGRWLNAQTVDEVTVSKVKLIIDEREYSWTVSGIEEINGSPETDGAAKGDVLLKPQAVISFLSFYPGQRYSVESFLNRCGDSELRLQKSGYVYQALVQIVPSRKTPTERTVIVSISSGFLWRFGGGDSWGMFGKEGLGGNRAGFRIFAGWNKNGAEYMNYRVGGIPLVLGGRALFFGPGDYESKQGDRGSGIGDHPLEAALTTGWLPNPDLMIGLDTASSGIRSDGPGLLSFQPFVSWRSFLGNGSERIGIEDSATADPGDVGGEVRCFWYPELRAAKAELSGYAHSRSIKRTILAVSTTVGLAPDDLPGEAGFDLYYTEDRNVRSGYTSGDLTAASFALATVELRHTLASFVVPPAMGCDIQLFLFTDTAGLQQLDGPDGLVFADAYGAGLRILFDNPIFAWFTFSYGMNHDGAGRFLFCGTAGF